MHSKLIGLVGGISASAAGLAGAYFSYKNAKGPRERRFIVVVTVVVFAFIGLALTVLHFFPRWRSWIFLIYVIILTLGITYINRRSTALRQEERLKFDPH
jgi:L-asparagine transporter-like permease